ncbi:hypothetical protein SmJEL517_g06190 [Synchytrium microbalum]|uniref:Gfo/Idh/MocA-like oxidoreductase N-terminal domain-containing protein n=1 Tax=Synchytrium microbalum TaxID=1806994 RepID=A0A507BS23_9FUNG|nr:uncharacterized protein SmJEL517_g06190 [Synchytrium microbalum]TPX30191.1 hypothetical protein SmJEL517_g06190 [Synchytrium microbalum]
MFRRKANPEVPKPVELPPQRNEDQVPLKVAIIGCGQRGDRVYGEWFATNRDKGIVVAIAEPNATRREKTALKHNLPANRVYVDWEDFVQAHDNEGSRIADALLVCTQDQTHVDIVEAGSKRGYDILCEKPLATEISEVVRIIKAVKDANVIFGVAHVLRYSPYTQGIQSLLKRGDLGSVVNVQHLEPIGNIHFSHSYVRGNWRNESTSSFTLLTKSCHDLDLLNLYFQGKRATKISSFGSLSYFRPENKPPKAGDSTRCWNCPAEKECTYSAKRIYCEPASKGNFSFPVYVITDIENLASVEHAVQTGPYGECVYNGTNNVIDSQIVSIEFEGGGTASFTMTAFTQILGQRVTRINGTKGEITGDMHEFNHYAFDTRRNKKYCPLPANPSGHGGGDWGVIEAFVDAVRQRDQSLMGCTPDDVLESHLLVFAAEESRRKGVTVDVGEYRKAVGANL